MAEYRITWWRDIPAMVTAREGTQVAKAELAGRFQEAIDERAMALDLAGTEAYLEQWRHGEWERADGAPDEVAARVAERLEAEYGPERLGAG
jgi:hypothetical protein